MDGVVDQIQVGPQSGLTVLREVSCLLTMCSDPEQVEDEGTTSPARLGVQRNVDVVVEDGVVAAIGAGAIEGYRERDLKEINAKEWVVMPAFVDSFASPMNRNLLGKETVLLSQGVSLEELQELGMGPEARLQSSLMRSPEERQVLFESFLARAQVDGVGVQEIKTGCCADIDELMSQWQFLCSAVEASTPIDCHLTCCGPAYPSMVSGGLSRFVEEMIDLLPQLASFGSALSRRAVDVKIQSDGFTKEMSDRWLAAALQHGFDALLQADRHSRSGGAELAAELARRVTQGRSRDATKSRVLGVAHGRYTSEQDLVRMAQSGVAVILLPTHASFTGEDPVDAAKLRASGVRVAFATGYDPLESPLHNMWLTANHALREGRFSVPEVLAGVTTEGAFALGLESSAGHIAVGQKARLLAFEGSGPEDFFNSPLGHHKKLILSPKSG